MQEISNQEKKAFQIVLNSKSFIIPSNSPSINDVDPDIYKILITHHQYNVKSNVRENVLQSFINNWIDGESIELTYDNINEYEMLSQEFDRISDLIQLFKNTEPGIQYFTLIGEKENNQKYLNESNEIFQQINENYQKIIQILFCHNGLDSNSHFFKKNSALYDTFQYEDFNSILNMFQKKVYKDGFCFLLDEFKKEAILIENLTEKSDVTIPSSIFFISQEFSITTIKENVFKSSITIRTINFSEDSKLKTIEKYAFAESWLVSIKIPSSVEEIQEKAFSNCPKLKNVEFDENSNLQKIGKKAFEFFSLTSLTITSKYVRFDDESFYSTPNLATIKIPEDSINYKSFDDDQFIFEKESDVLIFVNHTIKELKMPSFTKKIAPYIFANLTKLESVIFSPNITEIGYRCFYDSNGIKKVEFPENSELNSIKSSAFENSSLEYIKIPPKVTVIETKVFYNCQKLQYVEFCKDSNLNAIQKDAFDESGLEKIIIPSCFSDLQLEWMHNLTNLKKIEVFESSKGKYICNYKNDFVLGKSNIENDEYDVLLFANRDVVNVTIPSIVKKIAPHSFQYCINFQKVLFENDSKLEIIGEYSFYKSSLKEIIIPSNVKEISDSAFSSCKKLNKVDFAHESKLSLIKHDAFAYSSSLRSISIPSNVLKIFRSAFFYCTNLFNIKFADNSKIQFIGPCAFYLTSIEKIFIPNHIKIIHENSFDNCKKLKCITFSEDSELKIIERSAFHNLQIVSFSIPVHTKIIEDEAFISCRMLNIVEVKEGSELKTFNKRKFYYYNENIIIVAPSNMKLV